MNETATRAWRILLVDDHLETLQAMQRLLERQGHVVFAESSFNGAILRAKGQFLDLLITDLSLEDGNGADLLARINQMSTIPGIIISGFNSDVGVPKEWINASHRYFTKPVDFEKLTMAIAELCASSAK